MNVSLPPAWEHFVANQVRAGEFGNASEGVREALRLPDHPKAEITTPQSNTAGIIRAP